MYSLLMTRTSSRLTGLMMSLYMYVFFVAFEYSPRIIRRPLYSSVSRAIGINTSEFEYAFYIHGNLVRGTYEDYTTANAFFTRSLKKGVGDVHSLLIIGSSCCLSSRDSRFTL